MIDKEKSEYEEKQLISRIMKNKRLRKLIFNKLELSFDIVYLQGVILGFLCAMVLFFIGESL